MAVLNRLTLKRSEAKSKTTGIENAFTEHQSFQEVMASTEEHNQATRVNSMFAKYAMQQCFAMQNGNRTQICSI